MVSRKGYTSAKQYIIDLTGKYMGKIVPDDVTIHIKIHNIVNDEGTRALFPTIAYTTGNKEGTKALLVYDSDLIKTNMYNMKSKVFDALAVHELCHVKHVFEEPGVDPRAYHSSRLYLDCLKKHFPEPWAAKPMLHPDRYSLRAYLGSDDKIVPRCVNGMLFYICKECRHSALWNVNNIGHSPYHCEVCHSKKISWTKLDPMDAYRVAMINEIDFVERTAPAMWNDT